MTVSTCIVYVPLEFIEQSSIETTPNIGIGKY